VYHYTQDKGGPALVLVFKDRDEARVSFALARLFHQRVGYRGGHPYAEAYEVARRAGIVP
jgi:hypothetical protein